MSARARGRLDWARLAYVWAGFGGRPEWVRFQHVLALVRARIGVG